jgi:hypothetical protein
MPATKALLWFVLLGTGAAVIFFLVFPKYQPAFLKSKIAELKGYTPAQTPNEAMEKFRDCIRARDYESAARYCAGQYADYIKMGAEPAARLVYEVDALGDAVNTVGINSPDSKHVLDRMQPFPKDFKFNIKQPVSDPEYRDLSKIWPDAFPSDSIKTLSDKVAWGQISFELLQPGEAKTGRMNFQSFEGKIFMTLVPDPSHWNGVVGLKKEGNEKGESWKIYFPMTTDIREKVDYLKANAGNYAQALKNVKYAIKHDAASKNEFEGELSKQLLDAK